ncbi:MAG: carboxypeptidase-like regulatory domain-containing protein [Bacteroidetes bacterium]|nr:carboxypeptidase-like regulatory domain-containing protein [Bacteroidota bacterium]
MNAKQTLLNWLASGDIDRVLRGIDFVNDREGIKSDDVLVTQTSRFHMLQSSKAKGIVSDAEFLVELARIREAVLILVNGLGDHWDAVGLESVQPGNKSFGIPSTPGASTWRRGLMYAVLALLLVALMYIWLRNDSLQLTVYVQDSMGKPIPELQNTGHVIVRFDNDLRDPVIGENGRTNLGEIPAKFRGEEIDIVLLAVGYEVLHPGQKYTMNGKAVYLQVQRDQSLGLIQGIVKDRSGDQFLKGALVMIDQDTTTLTDHLGRFRLVLPPDKQRETYALTIRKEGFKVKSEYYKPKSGAIEIRLEK